MAISKLKITFHSKHILPLLISGAGILVLWIATAIHLFFIHTQLKEHLRQEAEQALSFVRLRLVGHIETVGLIPDPPAYLKNLSWLVDEFQSQPLLYGVLVWQEERFFLNSFPQARLPEKDLLLSCGQGVEKDSIYYVCQPFKEWPQPGVNILVGIDVGFGRVMWMEGLWHGVITATGGSLIMLVLGIFLQRLSRRQEELSKQLVDAEKLAAVGRLTSMLAHEVRNPLNSLSMGLQYLKELGQPKPELLVKMQNEVRKLDELIYELLQVAKGIEVRPVRMEARDVLHALEEEYLPLAKSKKVHFELVLDNDFSFQADFRWIMRAMGNLVRNALEAVPENGWVRVKAWKDGAKVHLQVKDNGPGIEKQVLKQIARPFYTQKKQGFGLGLFLVEMVAKAHNGKLIVESKTGEGAEFTLVLVE
ncbi:GHKL domain-containing protein [Desulfohalobiaceae bacterium Ax17]|uniref:sensor histidine kinase n=1 Tax=Desulfovulcanus ferrireducens TaxID=2831190 RepID=UPI00207BC745|nr:ATP-binding protein [Desulfovulcanus ferrireducens]MBT8764072.1 GHKL domain-containing protein [Desulfovulcanus ferrireducens]